MDNKRNEILAPARPSFTKYMDLALAKMGGKVLYATDDFFAEKEKLILQSEAIFIKGKFTEQGQWMDGWESRRKRTPGHDWAIIQLATQTKIHGFNIDTSHFLGNQPAHGSIEAINLNQTTIPENWETANLDWTEILVKSKLDPGSHHYLSCSNTNAFTHLKLNIYPDGGVARLRVYGEVEKDWSIHPADIQVDLASAVLGGNAIQCNDMFYSHMDNLIMPERGINMGDGWETKRNRTPNNRDWVVLRLAHVGSIKKVNIDTAHFKGNFPDTCSLDACYSDSDDTVISNDVEWKPLLPKQKLSAHHEHIFTDEVNANTGITHVRMNIFPDGGISRLRLYGHINH